MNMREDRAHRPFVRPPPGSRRARDSTVAASWYRPCSTKPCPKASETGSRWDRLPSAFRNSSIASSSSPIPLRTTPRSQWLPWPSPRSERATPSVKCLRRASESACSSPPIAGVIVPEPLRTVDEIGIAPRFGGGQWRCGTPECLPGPAVGRIDFEYAEGRTRRRLGFTGTGDKHAHPPTPCDTDAHQTSMATPGNHRRHARQYPPETLRAVDRCYRPVRVRPPR